MKIRKNITAYYCEYCKKRMFRKSSMILHEKFCIAREDYIKPKCLSCDHLQGKNIDITVYNEDYDENEVVDTIFCPFYCSLHKKPMHNKKSEENKSKFIGKIGSSLFPEDCAEYESDLPF